MTFKPKTSRVRRHQANPEFDDVIVGNVTVRIKKPTSKELDQRLAESRRVIDKLPSILDKPKLRLRFKATTPVYRVDPNNPQIVIQKIGKSVTRGAFENGVFVEISQVKVD